MAKKQSYKLKGTAYWAMIFGEPRPNYAGDGREWTIDLKLDAAGEKKADTLGLTPRIKANRPHSPFIPFFRNEISKGRGVDNKPIPVVDSDDNDWGDTRLGNGSEVEIEFGLYTPEFKGKKFPVKPIIYKVKVLKLVEYEGTNEEVDEEDFSAAA